MDLLRPSCKAPLLKPQKDMLRLTSKKNENWTGLQNRIGCALNAKLRFENHKKKHFARLQIGMKIGLDSKTGLAAPFLQSSALKTTKRYASLYSKKE